MPEERDILTREFAQKRKEQIENPSYDLFLKFESKSKKYNGICKIKFDLKKQEPVVFEHIGDVKKVFVNGKESVYCKKKFTLEVMENLILGTNEVEVHYTAYYDNIGAGMHRFEDPEDSKTYIYTHFEPYDAHRTFPCFDQPDLKAKLRLKVEIPKNWIAISNEDILNEESYGDKKLIEFNQTRKLSTYLYEVAVGDYDFTETFHNGISMKIYFRKTMKKYVPCDEIFLITKQGLDFYNDFFDYPYPFGKYDQIFVPEFNFGAMEQPGAVTFSENYLIRRKQTRTEKANLAITIMHEMAHMWFGDLVTMKWWSDLWLNESFADLMGYFSLIKSTGFRDAWENFYARKAWAYVQDQYPTTHPIVTGAEDTDDAFSNFDGISYAKGASVLKQLMFYIGEENFRNGLRNYFSKYEWGNTEFNDFLNCLEEASGINLKKWFEIWIKTTGVNSTKPVLDFSDNKIKSVKIFQGPSKENNLLRNHKTKLAFFYKDQEPVIREIEYKESETVIDLDLPKENFEFLCTNYGDWGYVKDYFDATSMKYVLENIKEIKDPLTRQMAYGSLWNMVRDAELNPRNFLDMLLENMPCEENLFSLERMFLRIKVILTYYSKEKEIEEYSNRFFELAWKMLLKQGVSFEIKNLWFNLLLFSVRDPDSSKNEKLISILEKKTNFDNFELDQDKRWGIIIRLNSINHPDSENFLVIEKEKDRSDRGEKKAAIAEVSNLKNKKKSWDMFLSGNEKSIDFLREAMKGFHWKHQANELKNYADLFFESVKRVFDTHDKYYAKAFFDSLFPLIHTEEIVLEKAKKYLEEFRNQNKLLVKSMKEGIDDLERALKILRKFG